MADNVINGYAAPDSTTPNDQLVAARGFVHSQGGSPSAQLDGVLRQIVSSVSRMIDQFTGRVFYPSVAAVKFFSAVDSEYLDILDAYAITTIETDSTGDAVYDKTWSSTDFLLAGAGQDWDSDDKGEPWEEIYLTHNGNEAFPINIRKGVKITGDWGYAATVPDMVIQACLMQVNRLYHRRTSPFGIAGPAGLGTISTPPIKIPSLDPDVKSLLDPLIKDRTVISGIN